MELHTTYYDDSLQKSVNHYRNYPEMLPFVGSNWESSNYKILLLGESHYMLGDALSKAYSERDYQNDWYNNNSNGLEAVYSDYINTRKVVDKADRRGQNKYEGALTIFYNPKAVIKNHFKDLEAEQHIFPFLSFYNYFQRPAFVSGQSIKNNKLDNEIAYNTLKEIAKVINPNKIIFCSKKAWESFNGQKKTNPQDVMTSFKNVIIDYTCHPGTSYWNKSCKSYGNRSGKQKFIDILAQ
jgi:hypothetical protein